MREEEIYKTMGLAVTKTLLFLFFMLHSYSVMTVLRRIDTFYVRYFCKMIFYTRYNQCKLFYCDFLISGTQRNDNLHAHEMLIFHAHSFLIMAKVN